MEPILFCPPGLSYDDAAHTYCIDGAPAPSVSTIIKVIDPDLYGGIAEDVLMRAAARGSAVHAMIAMDVRDDLDVSALGDGLTDDYVAWVQFVQDFGFECEYSERCVFSRKHRFAGTLDLAGKIKHRSKPGRWLIDIKNTAALTPLVAAQTAGYDLAAEESIPGWEPGTPRACLHIRDGKYKFVEYPRKLDRAGFIAARTINSYRDIYK